MSNSDFELHFEDLSADSRDVDPDSESESEPEEEVDPRAEAVNNIEALVLDFLTQLARKSDGGKPKRIEITLTDRKKPSLNGLTPTRLIRFPQKTAGPSSKPLAQLFRVANLMHEALVNEVPTTKRDMYYKYVSLFKTQATVDRLVDDLAATFDLGRGDLNVRASAKGLVCGSSIRMTLEDGSSINPSTSEGSLIISAEEIANYDVDPELSWVLIVEKEAVFQTLCRLRLADHPSLAGSGVIITGKGYPDVATRALIKTLADNLPPSIPILALVDGDPSGLEILSTYIYGSASMRHENDRLAAGDRVQWLGIRLSELNSLGIDKDSLLPITKYDEKKAFAMLRRTDPILPMAWRKELMHMLHTRRKAEIEILSNARLMNDEEEKPSEHLLAQYLVTKITQAIATHSDLDLEEMEY